VSVATVSYFIFLAIWRQLSLGPVTSHPVQLGPGMEFFAAWIALPLPPMLLTLAVRDTVRAWMRIQVDSSTGPGNPHLPKPEPVFDKPGAENRGSRISPLGEVVPMLAAAGVFVALMILAGWLELRSTQAWAALAAHLASLWSGWLVYDAALVRRRRKARPEE